MRAGQPLESTRIRADPSSPAGREDWCPPPDPGTGHSSQKIAERTRQSRDNGTAEEPHDHPAPAIEQKGPAFAVGGEVHEGYLRLQLAGKEVPDTYDEHEGRDEKVGSDEGE